VKRSADVGIIVLCWFGFIVLGVEVWWCYVVLVGYGCA